MRPSILAATMLVGLVMAAPAAADPHAPSAPVQAHLAQGPMAPGHMPPGQTGPGHMAPGHMPPGGAHRESGHGHGAHGMRLASPWAAPVVTVALHHRDELGLSPEQVQRLEQVRLDFARQAIRQRASIQIAELDLAALGRADQVDLRQAEVKLREIAHLRADLRLARLRAIETGKAELSPEQRAKLRALLDQHQRHHGHHPGHHAPPRPDRS